MIENLCEYKTYIRVEYEELHRKQQEVYEQRMQERMGKGDVVKVGDEYYDVNVIKMLCDNDNLRDDAKRTVERVLNAVKETTMSEFKVGDWVKFYISEDFGKNFWKCVFGIGGGGCLG